MKLLGYQHEKLSEAVRYLMLPDMSFEAKLAAAMNEFTLAFLNSTPSESARDYYLKVKQIMGEGGSWEERVQTLTPGQRRDVVRALWELDRSVSRDYYASEGHR